MKAYFDSIEKEVPEELREVFLDRHDTAVITIDMHDGHLSTDPDCPFLFLVLSGLFLYFPEMFELINRLINAAFFLIRRLCSGR